METISHNSQETIELGKKIGKNLKGGEIISLSGDLGGGKTTFMKGLAEALEIEGNVTSPTFVMLKVYPAKVNDKEIELVHIDAYRANSPEDAKTVGIEDYLNRTDVVMVIEWAEKIKEILPKIDLIVSFDFINENTRKITVSGANE